MPHLTRRKMKRKGGSKKSRTRTRARTKSKKYSTANLTPPQNLSDNFNLPEELLREVASFLTIDENVTLYKTQWENFSPKLKFLYTYEGDRDDVGPYEDTDYELKEDEIRVFIVKSVLKHLQAYIAKQIKRSLLSNNKNKKLLPKDIKYVHVDISLKPAVTRKGHRREQISHPPYDGDNIVINTTFKDHNYSVDIDGYGVVMHQPITTDELSVTPKMETFHGIKLYAHLI